MDDSPRQRDDSRLERIMASMPGWMLLAAGCAMIASITLMGPWIETRKLQWQNDVMALQASQLTSQQVAYEQFLTALREDDPVVVERMAYYHLRLKPDQTLTLNQLHQAMLIDQGRLTPAAAAAQSQVWQTLPTTEDLLGKPMYRPARSCPAEVVPDTQLVRLTTGQGLGRYVLGGLGVLCLFFGLLPPSAASASAGGATAAAAIARTACLHRNEEDEMEEDLADDLTDDLTDDLAADDDASAAFEGSGEVVMVSANMGAACDGLRSRVFKSHAGDSRPGVEPAALATAPEKDPQVAGLFAAAQAALLADIAADEAAASQAGGASLVNDDDIILTAELDDEPGDQDQCGLSS